jgi:iron(III) transport system ATP-binding protein
MSSLPAGAAAQVLLRPNAVRICRADAEAARLRGTISDVAFRGGGYDYVVEIGSGLKLAGLSHRRRHPRGDQVGLHLDPLGCFAYPADPTSRDHPPLAVANLPPDATDPTTTRRHAMSEQRDNQAAPR